MKLLTNIHRAKRKQGASLNKPNKRIMGFQPNLIASPPAGQNMNTVGANNMGAQIANAMANSGMLPQPPGAAPQVQLQSPFSCLNTPMIGVQGGQQCPDPRSIWQLTRRVFTTIAAQGAVTDYGNATAAGFGAILPGLSDTPLTPGSFVLGTNAQTSAIIRDLTITFNGFSGSELSGDLTGPDSSELILSYDTSWAVLLSGQISILNEPFTTVIPIGSAIKAAGATRAFWTQGTPTSQVWVSADMSANAVTLPTPTDIPMQPSASYLVTVQVPSVSVNGFPYTAIFPPAAAATSAFYNWPFLLTVLQENFTSMGGVPMQMMQPTM